MPLHEDFAETTGHSVVSESCESCRSATPPGHPYLLLAQASPTVASRGLLCLLTGETCTIELPEASQKVILGTNKGWLLTLGRNLDITLLHPFSRHQVPLPPLLEIANQRECFCDIPDIVFYQLIRKVAMSSTVPLSVGDNCPVPVIMAIMLRGEEFGMLAFARPGDKIWTDVKIDSGRFHDILYHKNKFYAVNNIGVFGCDEDMINGGLQGTKLASLPVEAGDIEQQYLAESSSGCDLLLIQRFRKGFPYEQVSREHRYYTNNFFVWKLELQCSGPLWIPVSNLGNESLFIGRTSSFPVLSSGSIRPNCIYFTDDCEYINLTEGHNHDMGIFSIEHGTVEPHFGEKSIHPIDPPLWYI